MNFDRLTRYLAAANDPEGRVITLTLDLSDSGILPPDTRVFVESRLHRELEAAPFPTPTAREAAKKTLKRIETFVHDGVQPGADGLFLVAGEKVWEAVELKVRLRNFIHVGNAAYLPPLMEARLRTPVVHVLRFDARRAVLERHENGSVETVARLETEPLPADAERGVPARTGTSSAGRERVRHAEKEAAHALLRNLADRLRSLEAKDPTAAVFVAGPGGTPPPEFLDRLPPGLRKRVRPLGPLHRFDEDVASRVRKALEADVRGRAESEMLEFHERRAEGRLVSLGPAQVMEGLRQGHLDRVFLDAYDPVRGGKCGTCKTWSVDAAGACGYCDGRLNPVSLTHEVVSFALSHPPLPITFVPENSGWLKDLGGIAGLRSLRGIRRSVRSGGGT